MSALAKSDIDIATRGADQFIRLYYSAYDSKDRVESLPKFYRATSSLTWNGNPIQGLDGLKTLIEGMPSTKHDVQSFDCHPIPGTTPPSLLVTVSGNVVHGKQANDNPNATPVKGVDAQPRVFTQTFMLTPDPNAPGEEPMKPQVVYYVNADALRFVG
ncbi:NTF2-like protein [Rickenella mellea]|uniref:NTF2-like protein n=1 Tax=Rickenella mellea TaxID=50990 RepID=A0A4Y7QLY2_9AGAM|nr:NTF2-like protein [Rickenella mellea]